MRDCSLLERPDLAIPTFHSPEAGTPAGLLTQGTDTHATTSDKEDDAQLVCPFLEPHFTFLSPHRQQTAAVTDADKVTLLVEGETRQSFKRIETV